MDSDLRYPIGPWRRTTSSADDRHGWIRTIAEFPSKLRDAVSGLDDRQLDTPYRPEGWTVRQLVHHVADSHINAYCRFRLTLTEETPTIRTYDQDAWAKLPDAGSLAPEVSLRLLDALHARWTALLSALDELAFERKLEHPEGGPLSLADLLSQYSWHCRHHLAHIEGLRERENW